MLLRVILCVVLSVLGISNGFLSSHISPTTLKECNKKSYNPVNRNVLKAKTESKFVQYLDLKNRPAPINIPRRRLELKFAVQMMRTSYNAVDWLDCSPMDEFQKDFFLYRQQEWDKYRSNHANIMQGDLADASYFDFISFAQYTISLEKLRDGREEFLEKYNAAGDTRRVKRNPQASPALHSRAVGQKLLDYIYATYSNIVPKLEVVSSEAPVDGNNFATNAQSILDIFTINAYCAAAEATEVLPEAGKQNDYALIKVELKVPANLWSSQVLRSRKAELINDFEIKVLEEYARRIGLSLKVVSAGVQDQLNSVYLLKLTKAKETYVPLSLWSEGEGGVLIEGPVPTVGVINKSIRDNDNEKQK